MHPDASAALSVIEPERSLPTGSIEAGLWARHHVEPSGRPNLAATIRLQGALDLLQLVQSVELLVSHHDLLRTRFPLVDDRPRRWIAAHAAHELLLIDARDAPAPEVACRTLTAVRQPFDLETGPLWRAILVRTRADDWQFTLAIHPLLADRHTLHLLLADVLLLYQGAVPRAGSRDVRDPEPPLRALTYWQSQLQGWAPIHVTQDPPRSVRGSARGARHPIALPDELALDAFDAPLDAILLAAFQIVLARYTGQSDIAVAAQCTLRSPDAPDATGPLTTVLPVRAELAVAATGRACVQRVAEALAAARVHACPYDDLVDTLGLPAVPHTMFAFEDRPALPAPAGLAIELVDLDPGTAPADLCLQLVREGGRVIGHFVYDSDVFTAAAVARLGEHFLAITRALADEPDRAHAELPMVSGDERHELLAWARGPAALAAPAVAIHELFEAQVDRTPGATAVAWDGGTLTYRELDRRANQLARHLVALGVGAETLVCVHLDRSPEMIVAIWAVLKAGGAYVPLDAAYPPDRLAHVLRASGVQLLVTQASLLPRVRDACLRAVCVDSDAAAIAAHSAERTGVAVSPGQLAYVIFTSGSTGAPRGVMIEHRSLVHYTCAAVHAYRITSADRVLQFASISFDASVEEIFPTLTRGATLVLRRSATLVSTPHFLAHCAEQRVTVLDLPTAYWHELVGVLARGEVALPDSVRLVIIGGEQASAPAFADWQRHVRPSVQLLNTYGPTEATVVTTVWDAAAATPDLDSVPIGRPLPGSAVYVLDARQQLLPVGAFGELYIGGPAVARGYLGEPALTADRFTRDPFADDPTARLYRTGDRCCVRGDGELEFLGRSDDQLKLHGHRIELGEIEAHLRAYPGVVDAVVIVRKADVEGEEAISLLGYVAAADPSSVSVHELRSELARWLVPHLIPTLMVLDRLPRTVGGKIDRRALPEPGAPVAARGTARHPVEALVQQLFAEILGVPVGIHDDFFALGGDSLSALELVTLVEARLHLALGVQVLYDHPTVAALTPALLSEVHGDAALVAPDDLIAESRLDAAIRVPAALARAASPARMALVTGATGFFGAFVLAELLAETRSTIKCVVRARSIEEARSRLAASWAQFFGGAELPADRVIAVPGDISESRFGLSEPAYRRLAESVDVIYHAAAAVNYLLPYRSLRAANVRGTEEVMRLAVAERLVPVHHVSSLGVFGPGARAIAETSPLELAGIDSGYAQSKWVAEKLCEQASALGVPVAIYRPGRLVGDSRTGASNAGDFLLGLIQSCVQLGAAPELDLDVDMVPVDFASAALVRLSQRARAGEVFHLGHPQPIAWRDLVAALASFGYPLRFLPFDTWSAAIAQLAAHRQGSRTRLVSRYGRDALLHELAAGYDCSATLAALSEAGCDGPPRIDEPLLHTGFAFLVRTGLLPRPAGRP